MSGYPDYTQGVTITGYTITSLPIDITAQTVGNITIDIAAQSLAQLNVNIAASAVTLDINIAASAVTLDINIASAAVTINVATAVGEHVDTDIVSSITLNVDITAQTVGNIAIDIAAQSVGNVSINIAASAISLNIKTTAGEHVDTDIVSSITLNVDITAQTVGNIAIDIAAQSVGNVAINIAASAISLNIKTTTGEHVDTDIVSSIQLDINIAASAVTVNIDIVAQTVGNLGIDIKAQTVNLNVKTAVGEHVDTDIVSSVTLNVDITAQTVGNISIDIAAQTVGDVTVSIDAQTVDLDIKTSGGTNIVIDKLTQAAYVERRSTLSNNGATASWTQADGNYRQGKYFPRGCRGFITTVDLYCKDKAAAGGTITVYLAPYIGAGYIHSATVTIPAGASADWRSATFNKMWNYDSLFIYVYASTSDMQHGYDTDTPYDYFVSSDAAVTWTSGTNRLWFRVILKGETVGDLPVSGTLNTINIPVLTSGTSTGAGVTVPTATETSIKKVEGYGTINRIAISVTHDDVEIRIYIDGTILDRLALVGGNNLTANHLNSYGYTASTPQIQLLDFTDGSVCRFAVTKHFNFKRSLEIKAYHTTGADKVVYAGLVYNLLS